MDSDNPHTPMSADIDDTGCHIVHVDMDAFFASVEIRERPELRGRQVIVGHAGGRGVVTSASYEARARGVRSAMPMSKALRMAPNAIVVEPSHGKYTEASDEVMAVFESITPLVQPLSIDEAFLDVSGALKLLGTPTQIGQTIRRRVREELALPCSVGIAPTMFVAKLATSAAKPDGLRVVPVDRVLQFLHPLPLDALWGVGDKTSDQLRRLGLQTVGDIANTPVATLIRMVGQAHGTHLHDLAWGRDPRRVTPEQTDRSVGAERTFGTDVDDYEVITAELLHLSGKLARRLREGGRTARTVSIKVRFADFTTITRSKSLPVATDVAHDIYAVSKSLFDALHLQRARVRLVGVRCENLNDDGTLQLELDGGAWRETEQVMDAVARKFRTGRVRPARLVRRTR